MAGLREPEAKGAMVRGIRATDISLHQQCQSGDSGPAQHGINSPLKRPVVAAVHGAGVWDLDGIVDCNAINTDVSYAALSMQPKRTSSLDDLCDKS